MRSSYRLKKLERKRMPVLSKNEQERRLSVFVEVETMVFGQPPSIGEIEAERQRLAQPVKEPTPVKLKMIAEEVRKIIEANSRPERKQNHDNRKQKSVLPRSGRT